MSATGTWSACWPPERKAGDQAPQQRGEAEEDTPLIPDELSEGGADSLDDGMTDLGVPVPRAHMPSSFGLTFCVSAETKKIKVLAHWGQYLRERKEDEIDEKTGRAKLIWKRHPRGGMIELPLKNGPIRPTSPRSRMRRGLHSRRSPARRTPIGS